MNIYTRKLFYCKGPFSLSKFSIKNFVKENLDKEDLDKEDLDKEDLDKVSVVTIKVFRSSLSKIWRKSCKHEKMVPTLTKYENIAVTLCLMSIAILRRRLRDRARVRRRATISWLLRREQRRHTIHFLKNCTLKTRTSSEIILEWTKQLSRCPLRK